MPEDAGLVGIVSRPGNDQVAPAVHSGGGGPHRVDSGVDGEVIARWKARGSEAAREDSLIAAAVVVPPGDDEVSVPLDSQH